MDTRLHAPWLILRAGIGLTATLAGIDKFFNLLTNWGNYVSPMVARLLPIPVPAFMAAIGLIELAVGLTILFGWTRVGAYVASAWLVAIAINLVIAGYYDVAVRDVVMSFAAFTLARLDEVRAASPVYAVDEVAHAHHGRSPA